MIDIRLKLFLIALNLFIFIIIIQMIIVGHKFRRKFGENG